MNLNKTVKLFNIGNRHFEIDELLDQRNWNGPETKLFDLFERLPNRTSKLIEAEFHTIKDAHDFAKIKFKA